jgi:hypothetical protein
VIPDMPQALGRRISEKKKKKRGSRSEASPGQKQKTLSEK